MRHENLWLALAFGTAVIGTTVALCYALDLPVVQKSYATKECVNVLSNGNQLTCEDMEGRRYRWEWIK